MKNKIFVNKIQEDNRFMIETLDESETNKDHCNTVEHETPLIRIPNFNYCRKTKKNIYQDEPCLE